MHVRIRAANMVEENAFFVERSAGAIIRVASKRHSVETTSSGRSE